MFKNRSMRGLISLALALAAALASPTLAANQDGPASAETGQRDEVLVLGRVSNNPRKDYPGLKALADYLATKLGDTGMRQRRNGETPPRGCRRRHLRHGFPGADLRARGRCQSVAARMARWSADLPERPVQA
jgi:hypothetical protein